MSLPTINTIDPASNEVKEVKTDAEILDDVAPVAKNLVVGYGVSPDKAVLLAASLLESKASMERSDPAIAQAKLNKLLGIARGFVDIGCPVSDALSLA